MAQLVEYLPSKHETLLQHRSTETKQQVTLTHLPHLCPHLYGDYFSLNSHIYT
jgi:hypothetical protein